MTFFAKQRLFYYKRYKLDIWGIFKNTLQGDISRPNYFVKSVKRLIGKNLYEFYQAKRQLQTKEKKLNFIIGFKFMDEESIEKVKKIKNYDYLDVSYDLALKNKREKKRVWNTERDPYFKMNIMVLELWKKKKIILYKNHVFKKYNK